MTGFTHLALDSRFGFLGHSQRPRPGGEPLAADATPCALSDVKPGDDATPPRAGTRTGVRVARRIAGAWNRGLTSREKMPLVLVEADFEAVFVAATVGIAGLDAMIARASLERCDSPTADLLD